MVASTNKKVEIEEQPFSDLVKVAMKKIKKQAQKSVKNIIGKKGKKQKMTRILLPKAKKTLVTHL